MYSASGIALRRNKHSSSVAPPIFKAISEGKKARECADNEDKCLRTKLERFSFGFCLFSPEDLSNSAYWSIIIFYLACSTATDNPCRPKITPSYTTITTITSLNSRKNTSSAKSAPMTFYAQWNFSTRTVISSLAIRSNLGRSWLILPSKLSRLAQLEPSKVPRLMPKPVSTSNSAKCAPTKRMDAWLPRPWLNDKGRILILLLKTSNKRVRNCVKIHLEKWVNSACLILTLKILRNLLFSKKVHLPHWKTCRKVRYHLSRENPPKFQPRRRAAPGKVKENRAVRMEKSRKGQASTGTRSWNSKPST